MSILVYQRVILDVFREKLAGMAENARSLAHEIYGNHRKKPENFPFASSYQCFLRQSQRCILKWMVNVIMPTDQRMSVDYSTITDTNWCSLLLNADLCWHLFPLVTANPHLLGRYEILLFSLQKKNITRFVLLVKASSIVPLDPAKNDGLYNLQLSFPTL